MLFTFVDKFLLFILTFIMHICLLLPLFWRKNSIVYSHRMTKQYNIGYPFFYTFKTIYKETLYPLVIVNAIKIRET